ncbi:Amidophosphoribosyltransferase [Verticillium dahliae VDG2]|nr:Amidophosphoribosyltransferase [Verticillium dahliae VDG2]
MSAPPTGHVRLATASPATHPDGTAATLSQLEAIARRAAANKADLLLLPEAYLGGYPRGADFGAIIGGRSAKGRAEYAAYFRQAIDLGDRAGGSLYCSAVYVDPARGVIGKRRKVMPTATERLIWAQGGTATLKAVSTVIRGTRVNMAAAICWENYMPMLRQALYAQNVNLYLAPTADARDAWLSLMRSVGCEGRCFVVSSNMAVREKPSSGASGNGVQRQQQQQQQGNGVRGRQGSCITEEGHEIVLPGDKSASTSPTGARKARRKSVMVEDGHEVVLGCDDDNGTSMPEGLKPSVDWTNGTKRADDAASGWSCRGGSSIVGPFGDVLAGPQWEDDETIIYADVNFEDCVGGRLDLDAGSSYSRNDSFKFSVEGLDLEPLPYY